jgi:organic hydroperoxide reductase OsmC/OhrA
MPIQATNLPPSADRLVFAHAIYHPQQVPTDPGTIQWPGLSLRLSDYGQGLPAGLPAEMDSRTPAVTPEHFLAASLASCLGLTLQLMIRRRPIPAPLRQVGATVTMRISSRGIPSIQGIATQVLFGQADTVDADLIRNLSRLALGGKQHCLISQAICQTHPVTLSIELDGHGVISIQSSSDQP